MKSTLLPPVCISHLISQNTVDLLGAVVHHPLEGNELQGRHSCKREKVRLLQLAELHRQLQQRIITQQQLPSMQAVPVQGRPADHCSTQLSWQRCTRDQH